MITALSPGTHSTVMLSNDIVAQYMRADYEHRDVDQYATGEDIYAPVQVDLSWSCVGDPLYYNIKVAKDNAFTEPIKFVTDIPSITLENLQVATIIGRYQRATIHVLSNPKSFLFRPPPASRAPYMCRAFPIRATWAGG